MRNIKLVVAYDGTAYHGFQRQDNALTVQQVLEEAIGTIMNEPVKITGAARTDAKVHAFGQVVNFKTTAKIPLTNIPRAVQSRLPDDITIKTAEQVNNDFHARYSAHSKKYRYQIYQAKPSDPFLRNFTWHIRQGLDIEAMDQAARLIEGRHDFSAFRASGSAPVNPVRTMFFSRVTCQERIIVYEVWGTGFLYHMVRNIVGTLVDIGMKRITLPQFQNILISRQRALAGITAPPQGLFLQEVLYEFLDIDK